MTRLMILLALGLCCAAAHAQYITTADVTSAQAPMATLPLWEKTVGTQLVPVYGKVWHVQNGTSVADMAFSITATTNTGNGILMFTTIGGAITGSVYGEWNLSAPQASPALLTPLAGTFANDTVYMFNVYASSQKPGGGFYYATADLLFAVIVGTPNNTQALSVTTKAGGTPFTGSVDTIVGSSVASLGLSIYASNYYYNTTNLYTRVSNLGTTGISEAEFSGYHHNDITRPLASPPPSGTFNAVGSHVFSVWALGLDQYGGSLHGRFVEFTVNVLPDPRIVISDSTGAITPGASAAGERDFGTFDLLALPSPWATITIANNGQGDLTLGGWNFSAPGQGAGGAAYTVDNTGYSDVIPQGQHVTLKIRLAGGALGVNSVWIEMTHDDPTTTSPFRFQISGAIVAAPRVAVSDSAGALTPGAITTFGNIDVAAMPTLPRQITIANVGSADLHLGTPSLLGPNAADFVLNVSGFAATLAPGQATSFSVAFSAATIGPKSATLTFTHDDSTVASPFDLGVQGVATTQNQPVITVSSLPPGAQNVAYGPVALQGAGGAAPYSFAAIGALPAGLSLTAAGGVSGTPTVSGVYALTVQITDNVGASGQQVLSLDIAPDTRLGGSATGGGGGCAATGGAPWPALAAVLLAPLWILRRRNVGA